MGQMTVEKPFVSPDVTEAVRKLRADGIEVSVQDICWLYELAKSATGSTEPTTFLSLPVIIPNGYIDGTDIVMPRITPGIRMWWQDAGYSMAHRAFSGNSERMVYTLAFLSAARKRQDYVQGVSAQKLYSDTTGWAWGVQASPDTVGYAVRRILGDTLEAGLPVTLDVKGFDPSLLAHSRFDVVLTLSALYGIDPDKLMWEYSEDQIDHLVSQYADIAALRDRIKIPKVEKMNVRGYMLFRSAVQSLRDAKKE